MFTFGIFSTHLPYIAFVLFYGFFFLIGIEKAAAGEIGEEQQIISNVVWESVDDVPDVNNTRENDCKYFPGELEFEQLLLYERKISLVCFENISLKLTDYRFSWFSRPPPVA